MAEIVNAIEHVVGKRAIYEVVERGSECFIDTNAILPILAKVGIKFGNDYLDKTLVKYYK